MSFLCRLVGHRWRYHGFPDYDRRRCFLCDAHEFLIDGVWR